MKNIFGNIQDISNLIFVYECFLLPINFGNNVLTNSVPTMYVDFRLLEFLLVSRTILRRTFAAQRIGLTEQ